MTTSFDSRVGPDSVRFALEAAGQAMFEFDPQRGCVAWADAAQVSAVLGLSDDNQLTSYDALADQVVPEDAMMRSAQIAQAKDEDRSYTVEYRVDTGNGELRWFEERGVWMKVGDDARLVGVIRRIDAQKSREEQLSYLAAHDELTGSLNRTRTKQLVAEALVSAGNQPTHAFFLVAIDNIGGINLSFGFDAADQVIRTVGNRFREGLADEIRCGRVAGTKFGLLAPVGSAEAIRKLAIDVLNLIRADVVETRSGGIAVSVCLGAVPLTDEVTTADMAFARAEAALDQARMSGPSSWSMFSALTDSSTARHRDAEMSDVILTALNERRVQIAFQPIVTDVDAPRKKYECLIRIDLESDGPFSAPNFIAAAERLGLVHLLDRRVLELATLALAREPEIELAVNVSWETVKDPVWADGYVGHLRANAHLADRLTVELTETRIVDAVEASEEFVARIKGLGAKFALDDFGAGYTSFRNLKALDIDILKIDGSFITGLAQSRDNQLFVRTLIDLARNFGMKTVAEWVDNERDAAMLKALGVDYLQGFYVGRPELRPDWTARAAVLDDQRSQPVHASTG
ncbi:MAG: EAL domain-containing protein [Pseudomonadota bacterium]